MGKKQRNLNAKGARSQFGTNRPSNADYPAMSQMVSDNQYASVAELLKRGREEAGSRESQKPFAISKQGKLDKLYKSNSPTSSKHSPAAARPEMRLLAQNQLSQLDMYNPYKSTDSTTIKSLSSLTAAHEADVGRQMDNYF